ncbi:MAG: hypothetical protein LKE48_03335 [Solobacterium sp.]|jgi:hypothetical protein|nr:hypothetical protein [Solobacterium sp.]MCH4281538.1 hypothetical protein [Solobacterium sp.]
MAMSTDDEKDKAIKFLMYQLHKANETIDSQFCTILHLEKQIRQYEMMNEFERIINASDS